MAFDLSFCLLSPFFSGYSLIRHKYSWMNKFGWIVNKAENRVREQIQIHNRIRNTSNIDDNNENALRCYCCCRECWELLWPMTFTHKFFNHQFHLALIELFSRYFSCVLFTAYMPRSYDRHTWLWHRPQQNHDFFVSYQICVLVWVRSFSVLFWSCCDHSEWDTRLSSTFEIIKLYEM